MSVMLSAGCQSISYRGGHRHESGSNVPDDCAEGIAQSLSEDGEKVMMELTQHGRE